MSSFLKPLKGSRKGFQIKPRGAANNERIKDAINRNRLEAMGLASPEPVTTSAARKPARKPASSEQPKCPNPKCPNPSAPMTDGFCSACGREIDASNIVAEVTFGESSSGAAVVHGSFIGADQGSASRNFGSQHRRLGGGASDNREKTIREARNIMIGFAHQRKEIPQHAIDSAINIFKLAMDQHWLQGRGIDKVAPMCLFAACRKEERCKVMLMDFAELSRIDYFELGRVYKDIVSTFSLEGSQSKHILPEDLIYRFCSKLDFGEMTIRVATDAIKLCQRMGRDWMVAGRRPSGICGACIVMAARMWNFRRTVLEVVHVVKVTTSTIEQRLDEFTVTESSDMSIEEFINKELLKSEHHPPSFYKSTVEWKEKMEKDGRVKKRKRPIQDIDGDESEQRSESGTPAPDGSMATPRSTPAASTKMAPPPVPRPPPDLSGVRPVTDFLPRSYDSSQRKQLVEPFDPYQVPKPAPRKTVDRDISDALDADNPEDDNAVDGLAENYGNGETNAEEEEYEEEEEDDTPQPGGRRGRNKGSKPVFTFSDEWMDDEKELEKQIQEVISDPHSDEHAKALATAAHVAHIKAEWARSQLPQRGLKTDEIIGEEEFADDPEVQFCLLDPEEVKVKEDIWVNANKAWLREQEVKRYQKEMEELGPAKKKRNRAKKPRIGEGQLTPAATPAEAAKEMLKKRSTWSKRINYSAIDNMLSRSGPASTVGSELTSRAQTPADEESPATPATPATNRPNNTTESARPDQNEEPAEEINPDDYIDNTQQPEEDYDEGDYNEGAYDEGGYDEGGYEEEEEYYDEYE